MADVVVVPIGFLAENKEVIYDLDVEVGRLCDELGINMVRAAVVGNHPRLVRMIRELVVERIDPSRPGWRWVPTVPGPRSAPATVVGLGEGPSLSIPRSAWERRIWTLCVRLTQS